MRNATALDRTVVSAGLVRTGKIVAVVACILHGFSCNLLAYGVTENPKIEAFDVRYFKNELLLSPASSCSTALGIRHPPPDRLGGPGQDETWCDVDKHQSRRAD